MIFTRLTTPTRSKGRSLCSEFETAELCFVTICVVLHVLFSVQFRACLRYVIGFVRVCSHVINCSFV
jgi:hypothetical protein